MKTDIRTFQKDMFAACVGAFATLPQAVAYGLIALSPLGPEWVVFGITASIGTAIFFGALSGSFVSNPFLISGPRAVTALVVATAIQEGLLNGLGANFSILLGFLAVIIAGLLQFTAGLIRLGHLVSHVPEPVIKGFVNGSALIVIFNSVPMILGLPDKAISEIFQQDMMEISLWAMCIGLVTIGLHFLMEGRVKFIPAALSALIIGSILYHIGVHFVNMPPGPQIGAVDLENLWHLPVIMPQSRDIPLFISHIEIAILAGLSIGLLTSFDTVLTASALENQTRSKNDINFDLRVHGLGNILMGTVGFLPGSAALSRSSAVIKAGAKTRWANIGHAIVFLLILLILAPLVAILPLWATSGMLIATALQAIDRSTLDKFWSVVSRQVPYPRVLIGDIIVIFVVVVTALVFDLIFAVGIGIALAVFLFVLGMGRDPIRRIYRAHRVHSKIMRPLYETEFLGKEGHRISVIEIQGPLFFGACSRLYEQAQNQILNDVEYLILDIRHMSSIDSTGTTTLRRLHLACLEAGSRMVISYLEPERRLTHKNKSDLDQQRRNQDAPLRWIWLNMSANGLIDALGEESIFDDTDSALAYCEEKLLTRFGKSSQHDIRGLISASPLFEGLSRQEIAILGPYVERHAIEKGQCVFNQGEQADRAYLLVKGRMEVLIDIPGSGRQKRVSVLNNGTLFGEMGLIDGSRRSAKVVALKKSQCFSIDVTQFEHLQVNHLKIVLILMRNINRQFADRLRIANNIITELEQ